MYSNYSNYGNYPMNYGTRQNFSSYQTNRPNNPGGDRVGGFLFPFVLGGITGGLLAPNFYPRPYYQPYYPPYYRPYPYYRYY